jgi:hypothetical protein
MTKMSNEDCLDPLLDLAINWVKADLESGGDRSTSKARGIAAGFSEEDIDDAIEYVFEPSKRRHASWHIV